ncbi:MAG: GTP-binding protein [Candidatus Aenigmarchaeota archaeon]|nr:GTP-binding protein [Candidatus Aenigmarchaeota archaeon]
MKIPVSVITGYLGAGKTTLLRKIIAEHPKKLAVLMNEFGEIGIDGDVIKGKNIDMIELSGGCVCCSLSGEFDAAIKEISKLKPEMIIVETTGVAEPDAIVLDLDEIKEVKLDSVITIVDCDAMVKFPSLGHTGRTQIEIADIILLNKTDLVNSTDKIEEKVRSINEHAHIFRTVKCGVAIKSLFGLFSDKAVEKPDKSHTDDKTEFFFYFAKEMKRDAFELFLQDLEGVYRAKGFVKFRDGTYLFNYVSGRWDFEPFKSETHRIVFIGQHLKEREKDIIKAVKGCERVQVH